jgi:hypothetical protein
MLLDELLAQREHAGTSAAPAPEPVLMIDPVAVPPAGEIGRRAARQRLAALEDAARRNLRSAEEARRVLAAEHERLREEASARLAAQDEVAALQRELERLRESETRRADQLKTYAARAARAEISAEHEQVVEELERLQGCLRDHDGLLEDYAQRLREEQEARVALRGELEQTEAARRRAEHGLERAVASTHKHAEEQVLRLANAEDALAAARGEIAARDAEIFRLHEAVGQLEARIAELEAELVQARASVPAPVPEVDAAPAEPTTDRPPLARRRPRLRAGDDLPAPAGFRRSAMAELTAIATTNEADEFTPRK